MPIYLPIAEIPIDLFVLLGLGISVGFLSGLFGVGGGFLLTPILIFLGIPPLVAVGSQANQTLATSVTSSLAHWQRGNVDLKMGIIVTIGGLVGSTLGVQLLGHLKSLGQVDLIISLLYVFFLGLIGIIMFVESSSVLRYRKKPKSQKPYKSSTKKNWLKKLPHRVYFQRSRIVVSIYIPLIVGALVGFLAAMMGTGGGFIMVPAMIYLLGMPTSVVIGTSLFQIVFVAINVTLQQAVVNHTVDVVLALVLFLGSVVGVRYGVLVGTRLKAAQLRFLLAILVLAISFKLGAGLIIEPLDKMSLEVLK